MKESASSVTEDAGEAMKARLRSDLRAAMKRGDKRETALLRQLVAAFDNAEAVPLRQERASIDRHAFIDGSAEQARRVLAPGDVYALLKGEMDAHIAAAAEFMRLGAEARSVALETEVEILRRYVPE